MSRSFVSFPPVRLLLHFIALSMRSLRVVQSEDFKHKMAEFRRNASKTAEETVYSSDNENDGYLSESDDGDGDERDESFPEEDVERFTAGSPANFLEDLSENTSVLEHTKQRLNSELSSTPAQLFSKKPIKRMIDKKSSHESDESDSVSAGKKQKKEGKKQEKLLWSQVPRSTNRFGGYHIQ